MSIDLDDTIKWEDPPPDGRRRYQHVIDACRQHPGKWAFVSAGNAASRLTHYKRTYGTEGLEWTSRRVGDKISIYVRAVES